MITVDAALETILAAIPRLETETVDFSRATGANAGRILAADITALRNHPAENQSAMDGYALRRDDLNSLPATLEVIGEAPAGKYFSGKVAAGQAVRIFTGGALPEGADTVVMQEDTEKGSAATVTVKFAPPRGKHVRLMGNDFRKDTRILKAGTRLTARALGLALSAAGASFSVARRPRIALMATGDELVPPGVEPSPGQLVAANSAMLAALFRGWGAEIIDLGIARDSAESLREMARGRTDFDMLVTIGGASVGDYDLVQSALANPEPGSGGLEVEFWKIAMRPGKPLIFGQFAGKPMIGLPGNPVSAFVCAFLFALPAIDAFQGASEIGPRRALATLDGELPENGPRQGYLRGCLLPGDDGALHVALLANQDSAALSNLAAANAFIVRPPGAPAAKAGEPVPVLLLDAR